VAVGAAPTDSKSDDTVNRNWFETFVRGI